MCKVTSMVLLLLRAAPAPAPAPAHPPVHNGIQAMRFQWSEQTCARTSVAFLQSGNQDR